MVPGAGIDFPWTPARYYQRSRRRPMIQPDVPPPTPLTTGRSPEFWGPRATAFGSSPAAADWPTATPPTAAYLTLSRSKRREGSTPPIPPGALPGTCSAWATRQGFRLGTPAAPRERRNQRIVIASAARGWQCGPVAPHAPRPLAQGMWVRPCYPGLATDLGPEMVPGW